MRLFEFRELETARRFVAQGRCQQRAVPVVPAGVRAALEWAVELLCTGEPLPPLGFVADLGHVVFGLAWEDRTDRPKQNLPHVSAALLTAYEDHVLGKIYADRAFSEG